MAMWQKWPPQSWHGMTLSEAARVSEAYNTHLELIEPFLKMGRLF